MPDIILTCPACQFSKVVDSSSIPQTTKRVTCPKCHCAFRFLSQPSPKGMVDQPSQTAHSLAPGTPAPAGIEPEADLRKPKNLQFALLFVLLIIALLAGRLYFSNKAIESPSPNFITASEQGVATLWLDRVMVTDHAGNLLRQIDLPGELIPTQMIWAGSDLWVADYSTHRILIVGVSGQHWLALKGPKISGHFKVAPDFPNNRIFVSAGHTIQVYDLQGGFKYSFGKEGQNPGELKFPNQFLLEESGKLLIANTKSPAIDRYAPDGKFVSRIITPTGDDTYKYPTNVVLAPERIVTLEADGYLQNARIALYDRDGNYLGRHEKVEDFNLIGDIAAWEDRVFATDLANFRIYAFSAADLSFLGDYSADLKRLGDGFRKEFKVWDRLSGYALLGMLAMLVPTIYFYAKFRKQGGGVKAPQPVDRSVVVAKIDIARQDALNKVNLDTLGPINFIAIETRMIVDILSGTLLGLPILTMLLIKSSMVAKAPFTVLIGMNLALLAGLLLSFRSSWGCPVSQKKARKLLSKLVKNKGHEILAGVEQVGIGFCVDKSSLLLLMAPRQLTIAEFNWFGRLSHISRLDYRGISVADQKFVLPAITLAYSDKKKTLQATDRSFLNRLRTALESYRGATSTRDGYQAQPVAYPLSEATSSSVRSGKPLNSKAALLSALFPGLGQFYKRDIIRGALFMVGFLPAALSVAVNFEPALVGSIDWAPESVARLSIVLLIGISIYAASLWDALKN